MNYFQHENTEKVKSKKIQPVDGFQRTEVLKMEKSLFEGSSVDNITQQFDFCNPDDKMSDTLLAEQNQKLLAFRNSTKRMSQRPQIKSPLSNTKRNMKLLESNKFAFAKEPLAKLPDLMTVTQKESELEKNTLQFNEDPIAYFSKRKDGRGHRFIYLVHERKKNDPYFSPYDLVKVPSAEIGTDYFTMSASGISHFLPNGDTEMYFLDQWSREKSIYASLRKLKFFATYFTWKSLHNWRLFLKEQRFKKLLQKSLVNVQFTNPEIFKNTAEINIMQNEIVTNMKHYLLCFPIGKKFKLHDFEVQSQENTQQLVQFFNDFINRNTEKIVQLFEQIADPIHVQVRDDDFRFTRRHPNIDMLERLEEQKAIVRYQRTEEVNRQIKSLGDFIRLVDYIILETLTKSCVDCWEAADHNASQEGASIFQVEVLFAEDGSVTFQPNLTELESSIVGALNNSIKTLNNLPRVLKQEKLRVLLSNGGNDVAMLYANGPVFEDRTKDENVLPTIQGHILKTLRNSYNDAFNFAQTFTSFYPIYKMGQVWDPYEYVTTRGGEKFVGTIPENPNDEVYDDFLINTQNQPVVNFEKCKSDIEKFIQEEIDVNNLRQGIVKGVLHIDLKTFRQSLAPIPVKAKLDLTQLLQKLARMKITQVDVALTKYSKVLKMEPQTLEAFVSFCNVFRRAEMVKDAIQEEIKFVDAINQLFDSIPSIATDRFRNPLHAKYTNYENDLTIARTIKDSTVNNFTKQLKQIITDLEQRLNRYYEKASAIPPSISLVDTEKEVPHAAKILAKVKSIEAQVKELVEFQDIIGVSVNKFAFYSNVLNVAQFAQSIYTCVQEWQKVSDQITKVPFAELSVDQFREDVVNLNSEVKALQNRPSSQTYPILNELATKVNEVAPFIDQIAKLASSRMQPRHWNVLFEACDQQVSYNPRMTTEELLRLGILSNKERIEQTAGMAHGEYMLEAEFAAITNYWNKVQMPIIEPQGALNEENLLLGSTDELRSEIDDALLTISQMLQRPYIQGIRDTVTSLAATLENIAHIIEAWQLFQSNWLILSVIFSHDNTRSLLPQQANKFTGVQRKWSTIARHTVKDTRLFSVCAFPSLLDALRENNENMEAIIASLGKLLDTKRNAMPRLYFLSNDDVLQLISTSKIDRVDDAVSKMMMHVAELDCRDAEGNRTKDAQLIDVKVHGIVGRNGETLPLVRPVDLAVSCEVWLAQLFDQMRESVRKNIISAVESFEKLSFAEFIAQTNSYSAYIAMNVQLGRIVEEELKNGTNTVVETFNNYISTLTAKLNEKQDHSALLASVIAHRDRYLHFRRLEKERKGLIPQIEYESTLMTVIEEKSVYVRVGLFKSELGYEYWGRVPFFVMTPSHEQAFQSLARMYADTLPSIILSGHSSGKNLCVTKLAADTSHFLYSWLNFPDSNDHFLGRILVGTAITGSWTLFSHPEKMSHSLSCSVYGHVSALYQQLAAGVQRTSVATKSVDLNQSARIFLTASATGFMDLPSMYRSTIRAIGLSEPDTESVCSVSLTCYNFDTSLAKKIVAFIQCMSQINSSKHASVSRIGSSLEIVRRAVFVRERAKCSDEMAVILSCFHHFTLTRSENEARLIFSVIESVFKTGYSNLSEKVQNLALSEAESKLDEMLKDEFLQSMPHSPSTEKLASYLAKKAIQLWQTLQIQECVLLTGPPRSGKTTIVRALEKCLRNQSLRTEFKHVLPLKVFDCYTDSDSHRRLFGYTYDDSASGQTWAYGQLQSILHQMSCAAQKVQTAQMAAVRFDGRLDDFMCSFLTSFLPRAESGSFRTSSLNMYPHRNLLKVIFECDSVESVPPSLFSRVSIVSLITLQLPFFSPLKASLKHPVIPLNRAASSIGVTLSNVVIDVFNRIVPSVVSRLHVTPNRLLLKRQFMNVVMYETIPESVALALLLIIKKRKLNADNDLHVHRAMSIALNRIVLPLVNLESRNEFEAFLVELMGEELPSDWLGFNIPDALWNFYPKPTISALDIDSDAEFVPLDTTFLDQQPVFKLRAENKMPFFTNDVHCPTVQFISALQTARSVLEAGQNVIIHGPDGSGKSSFLQLLFKSSDILFPVTISSSELLTAENMITFIIQHTPLLSKVLTPSTQNKIIVLCISGVEKNHTAIQEFVRSIIEINAVQAFSATDPKVYEILPLMKFATLVTTDNISDLSPRFINHFTPIGVFPLTKEICNEIAHRILLSYGYNEENADFIIRIGTSLIEQFSLPQKPLQILRCLFLLAHEPDQNTSQNLVTDIFYELYFRELHRLPISDVTEKVEFIARNECRTEAERNAALEIIKPRRIILPVATVSKDLKTFDISVKHLDINTLSDKLAKDLAVYNTTAVEKVTFRITPAIVRCAGLLIRGLQVPGTNILLTGPAASGKYSLVRVVSHSCEFDFVHVAPPTWEEQLVPDDRRFSLYALLRDVITNAALHQKRSIVYISATDSTVTEVLMLASLAKTGRIAPFFSRSQLDDLYARFANSHSITFEQRLKVQRQISRIIRINVHIVITATDGDKIASELASCLDMTAFAQIRLNNQDSSYAELAAESIEQSQTKKLIASTKGHIAKVLASVASIANRFCPVMHPNFMHDFIDSFCHFAASDYQNLLTKNENVQMALSFISKLEVEARTIDRRLDSLAPALQRLQVDSESLQSSYSTRKEAIDNRQSKLLEDKKTKVSEVEALKDEVELLEKQYAELEPQVLQYLQDVKQLTDRDIDTIRISAADPMPSMRLLMEVFCIFLDLTPSYERNGQKLLMDPKFIELLVDGVCGRQISPKALDIAEPYFSNDSLNPSELEATAPALLALYRWIRITCECERARNDMQFQKRVLDEKERSLRQYLDEMDVELASIAQVSASLENELRNLQASKNSREQMENDYRAISERKSTLDAIFRDLDAFSEKWQGVARDFPFQKEQLVGSSVLLAFYLVFGGVIPEENRGEANDELLDLLRSSGVDIPNESVEDLVKWRFVSIKPDFYHGRYDTITSLRFATDVHHVFATMRTPLLVDCDGLATSVILRELKGCHIKISVFTSSFDHSAAQAVAEGKTLVVTDVLSMHPSLKPLLTLDVLQQDDQMVREVRIGGRVVQWDPNFRLILISPVHDASLLPSDLIARTTLIDVTSSTASILKHHFMAVLASHFHPESLQRVISLRRDEINKRVNEENAERDILDTLADIVATQNASQGYDYLSDNDTIQELLRAKEQYLTNKQLQIDTAAADEYRNVMRQFQPIVDTLVNHWMVITRDMPNVTQRANPDIGSYINSVYQLLQNDGYHSGSLLTDQANLLRTSLSSLSLQLFLPGLTTDSCLFFMFCCAHRSRFPDDHDSLRLLCEHLRESSASSISFSPAADRPSTDPLERIMFAPFERSFDLIIRFIAEEYGDDFFRHLGELVADRVVTNASSVPALIVTDTKNDPSDLVDLLLLARSRVENVEAISLSDDFDLVRNAKRSISTATTRGNWVVLRITRTVPAVTSLLSDVFSQMTTTSINTNFRLVVITNDLSAAPPTMSSRSKSTVIPAFQTVKSVMQRVITHHAPSVVTGRFQKYLKKLVYALASLFAFVMYRRVLRPNCFNLDIRIPFGCITQISQRANTIFTDDEYKIPFENLRDIIIDAAFCSVTDKRDRTMIEQLIKRIIRIETFQDDFKVGVGPEAEAGIWTMPDDSIPLSSFGQFLQQIPPFPRVETLGVDPLNAALRSWVLSRESVRPFISYAGRPEIGPQFISIVEDIASLVPRNVATKASESLETPELYSLSQSAILLNGVSQRLSEDLKIALEAIKSGNVNKTIEFLLVDHVPIHWMQLASVYTFVRPRSFMNHLLSKARSLTAMIENFDGIVNCKYVDNISVFMYALLSREAIRRSVSAADLAFSFEFVTSDEELVVGEGEIILKDLVLLFCVPKGNDKIVRPDKSSKSPYLPIPGIKIKIIENKNYPAPNMVPIGIFHEARSSDRKLSRKDRRIINGTSSNFICNAYFATDDNPSYFIVNGSAIYCRIAEQFM